MLPTTFAEALERLRGVLALEQKQLHQDLAAPEGLDAFAASWAEEVAGNIQNGRILNRLKSLEYRTLTPEDRAALTGRLLQWTEAVRGTTSPPMSVRPEAVEGLPSGARRSTSSPRMGNVTTSPARGTRPLSPTRKVERSGSAKAATASDHSLLGPGIGLDSPITEVKGLAADVVRLLGKLGVATVRDMLYYFPSRHIDFSNTQPISSLKPGMDQTAVGMVIEAVERQFGPSRKRMAAEVVISDETGSIRAIWFNQPFMARTLKKGMRVAFSGRINLYRGRRVFENPEYDIADRGDAANTGRLVPIYPLTPGLSPRRMRGIAKRILDGALDQVGEFVPTGPRDRMRMLGLREAVRQAHFPSSEAQWNEARRRLAFDELFLVQLGVLGRKREWKDRMPGHPLRTDPQLVESFTRSLPFSLTSAQKQVMDEVLADLGRSTPMSRLIQGEVGSGKTVIALAGLLVAVANRQQAAFMAPTELLAEQHFRTVSKLLSPFALPNLAPEFSVFHLPNFTMPLRVGLLMGSTIRKRKQEFQQMAARGEIDILIGTHALFQKEVEFNNLGLAIVDEQHRFGVMQRSELRQKGYNPHLLVMTATPIPRSLALTLYGDLDVSVIDELPPGRQEIRTRWLDGSQRDTAYRFIRREVDAGRQAFIVYPLVEESEKSEMAGATEEHERLSRDVFTDLKLGLLNGRMKAPEKDAVMQAFRSGETHILVSTSVVEVGIDVPNATVMMIESADHFGLAQLHQFRGRVGRGEHQSYCILVSESPSTDATERLGIIEKVHDGFVLAEEDLRLRGAGEFFGTRQSGLPDLRMARISDSELLEQAHTEATRLFAQDPDLQRPEHNALAVELERAWAHRTFAMGEA